MLVQDLLLQYWAHRLQQWAFYKKCNCEKELGFWQCGPLKETLGHLDLLIIWTAWISWTFGFLGGALGFLASRTIWQFWHLGYLDLLAIWIAWISWTIWVSLGRILGLVMLWNSWQFSGSTPPLNGVSVTYHKFYLCTIRWWNQLVYAWVSL